MSQLTPEQISLGLSSHRNRHLFSDHYLGHVLRSDGTLPAAQADAQALLAWLTELYETVQPQTGNHSEQQLEDHWFRPILERLGHVYERQAKVPGLGGGVKFPDFVFFPSDAARAAALQHQQTPDYVRDALAVGEVKRWGIPLGKRQGGAPTFDNGNPSFQIDYYLKATDLRWE